MVKLRKFFNFKSDHTPAHILEGRDSGRTRYKKFYSIFFGISLSTVALTLGVNFLVDPYAINHSPVISAVNSFKIGQLRNIRLHKAVAITRENFNVLIIGSSRVLFGIDPTSSEFIKDDVAYNLGIQGLTPYETLAYLEHAYINQPDMQRVILGLDFWVFDHDRQTKDGFEEYRLNRRDISMKDLIKFNFSLFATKDSFDALKTSHQYPKLTACTDNGFCNIEARKITLETTETDSWEMVFFQWIDGEVYSNAEAVSQKQMSYLKDIVEFCHSRNIKLDIFITPNHALDIYKLELQGKLKVYEDWKKDVAKISPYWDFADFNSVVTEPASLGMENYVDTSHFTSKVGGWIISRIYSETSGSETFGSETFGSETFGDTPADFGVYVDQVNVDEHIENSRNRYDRWKNTQPSGLMTIQDIFNK